MQDKIIAVSMLVIGAIHLIPVTGVIGVERLSVLYGVGINDANMEILMRHRAILFGLLGLFFIYSAFDTKIQPLAFVAAFISIVSFFWLVKSVGGYNTKIFKVIVADIVAFACLLIAVSMYFIKNKMS